jgi:succinate dehydrogenase/fumarate reductase flavoprotein subunit
LADGAARVIVVGTGAAGLAAALSATAAGASVTVLERGDGLGGTTAYSAGTSWLPGNHLLDRDVRRDAAAALVYLRGLGRGDADPTMMRCFTQDAGRVARALEASSALRWRALAYPDYHTERVGATTAGRSLEPRPFAADPSLRALVRRVPFVRTPSPATTDPAADSADAIQLRREAERTNGTLTGGRALVGALWAGVRDSGAVLQLRTRARELVVERGRVIGVRTPTGVLLGRVVLATGGYERDAGLVSTFLGAPSVVGLGAPECEGDGLKMALGVGARLGNMSEAWWCPGFQVPGEVFAGGAVVRISVTERARPGSLCIDSAGRRFADESQDYSSFGRSMRAFDPGVAGYPRSPSWLVFDAGYRAAFNLGPLTPECPDPPWLMRASDVAGLAAHMDVSVAALEATVADFNAAATAGVDVKMRRGTRAYGRFIAGGTTLGPVRSPPFFAVPLSCGCLGTNGGPRTDACGRVLSVRDGRPLPGLYAAGNVSASAFGAAYPGAGGTIGPALVFGFRAGESAAAD